MAKSDDKQLTVFENEYEKELKHLDFVEVAAECGVVFLTGLYQFTKENSFLLKPGFIAVEEIVTGIIGPVCDKYHYVPFQILEFLDRKVDEFMYEVDWQHAPLPTLVKQVVEKALAMARELVIEIYQTGLPDAAVNAAKEAYLRYKPVVKELFFKYEPVAEEYTVWAWWWFNRVPIVSHMAQKTASNAMFWAERYNQVVDLTAERGYGWASHMPLIPVERISQVLAESANGDSTVNGDEDEKERIMAVAY